jgi:predicted CxxxxCH...CXXCH cytochrome family protein
MMRTKTIVQWSALLILLLLMIYANGCSSAESGAPSTNEAHPQRYIMLHAAEANADLPDCRICHGMDFSGNKSPIISCFSCHDGGPPFSVHPIPFTDPWHHGPAAKEKMILCRGCHGKALNNFNGGIVSDPNLFNNPAGSCSSADCHPTARAHPTSWQGANGILTQSSAYDSSHRTIKLETVTESCILCHKTDGPGSGALPGAPSCFSANFTNTDGITSGCHASGPGYAAPHDIPFIEAASHGPEAKADLAFCQQCHGTPGTIQFDGGIAPTACSSIDCHAAPRAHPTGWQGSNDSSADYLSSHRTAGSLDNTCAICHNVEADAPGPHPQAPSCFTAGFTNADGSTSGCHSSGPGAPHAIPFTDAALHGPEAKNDLAYCQQCHGTQGTIEFNGGTAATSCSSTQCHPAADAHPTSWQGTNDNTSDYLSTHRNALAQNTTCAICHDFTEDRQAPNPAAPSCFTAGFTNSDGSTTGCHSSGPGAPHPIPFSEPDLHGPEAKADLRYCQECHAQPSDGGPGSNPRFNVARGSLVMGCEDCHTQNTAHPVPSWSGVALNSHKTAGNLATACALCHGTNLQGPAEGGIGTACRDCHMAGSPLDLSNCASCHNDPPNSAPPAGNVGPNREGAHGIHDGLPKVTGICITCHNGSGTNTNAHFDTSTPADVSGLITYDAESGMFTYDPASRSCAGVSCHGGQTTPDWLTGTLDVAEACKSCHVQGTGQFNSYNSGEHDKHVRDKNLFCTECHDPNKLAADHFSNLDTPEFEGRADLTMKDSLGYNPATNQGCNVADCHEQEKWF